ncbi:MAG TPA: histidine phosphatase family protein [Victivallales bacterium]|nr:histidine phosphatase family protein [Victivallales bacterium]
MKLYFIRHGESEANVQKVFSNRGIKHGLTSKGILQAEEASKQLYEYKINQIYSSPLLRAQQTTRILHKVLNNCPVKIANELREADTGFEDEIYENCWLQHIELVNQWLSGINHERKINDGENFNDIKKRFLPFINKILEKGDDALLVSHGCIYKLMYPEIMENIDYNFAKEKNLSNCDIVIAEIKNKKLYCTNWCGEKIEKL